MPSEGYSPEAFALRLRNLCEGDLGSAGDDWTRCAENQTERAVSCAREQGLLDQPGLTWDKFITQNPDLHHGTEHVVDLTTSTEVGKITIPPGFGLLPRLRTHPVPNLRGQPGSRQALEFGPSTPLEYLERLADSNAVFGDDNRLQSVILWEDGLTSICVTQPYYGSVPASPRQIEDYFLAAGWKRISDPTGQHVLFFNYAFGVLAVDALPRNCYISDAGLQPFDVILHRPDDEMAAWLKIYD